MTVEFNDTFEWKVSEDTLRNLRNGQWIKNIERPINEFKDLCWAIYFRQINMDEGSIYFWISKPAKIKASGTCYFGPVDPREEPFNASFDDKITCTFLHCFKFSQLGRNGVIRVNVTFTSFDDVTKKQKHSQTVNVRSNINDFITSSNHCPPDVLLVVDDKSLEIHRHILYMISPVFQADIEQIKTDTVNITGFDFETVKYVIDYCYGRKCNAQTALDCVKMLRFADNYGIQAVTKTFEPIICDNITIDSFCAIAQYAWDCERKELQSECAKFFKDNIAIIGLTESFVSMHPLTIAGILRAASSLSTSESPEIASPKHLEIIECLTEIEKPTVLDLTTDSNHYPPDACIIVSENKIDVHQHYLSMLSPVFHERFKDSKNGTMEVSDFDFPTVKSVIECCYGRETHFKASKSNLKILSFAYKYDIQGLIKVVEDVFLVDLSPENFSSIAQYAWEFKKEGLKLRCAEFYRKHHEKIQFTPDFVSMNPSTMVEIIRTAASIDK